MSVFINTFSILICLVNLVGNMVPSWYCYITTSTSATISVYTVGVRRGPWESAGVLVRGTPLESAGVSRGPRGSVSVGPRGTQDIIDLFNLFVSHVYSL